MIDTKIIKDMVAAIKEKAPKTSAYDTTATVTRTEKGIAWVHIPGGVKETPVKMTIDAKKGDTVQVRISGGSAFLVGNATAPPTDDTTAKKAQTKVNIVEKAVKAVKEVADKAAKIAGNTRQYFWFTSEGTDTGAHITEIPQEDFLADPENGGGNLLARSNGIAVRDGLTELATFGESLIELGKNSVGSAIQFCGGVLRAVASDTEYGRAGTFQVRGDANNTVPANLFVSAIKGEHEAGIRLQASANSSQILLSAQDVQLRDHSHVIGQTATTTWTAPTPYSSRCTIEGGGYFVEGKNVYIELAVKLTSALSGGANGLQICSIPTTPARGKVALAATTDTWAVHGCTLTTSGSSAYFVLKALSNIATSETIYISGHFVTA